MPHLEVRTGPDQGRTFSLNDGKTKIGRHPDNHVVLSDKTISRFHAHIVRSNGSFIIRDLSSTQGTIINGMRIASELVLNDKDHFRLGKTDLTFKTGTAAESKSSAPSRKANSNDLTPIDQAQQPAACMESTTIRHSVPSDTMLNREELSRHRLDVLSKVARALRSASELEDLLSTFMDAVVDIFHPDRGVILLSEEPGGDLNPKVVHPKKDDPTISHSIVKQAIHQRMALMVTDAAHDQRFNAAESVVAFSIQAAICCPLVCKEKILGALYLDTRINPLMYHEEDLVLLNLIAANAAMAIENAVLIREKFKSRRLSEDELGPIIAQSAKMKDIERQIKARARRSEPILITGKPGTGKHFAAMTIHRSAGNINAPFITIDCADYAEEDMSNVLFGSAQSHDFLPAKPQHGEPQRQADGALYRANRGTLVLRHIGALDPISQKILSQYLDARSGNKSVFPRTRVIATTSTGLDALVKAGSFLPQLAGQLAPNAIEIPRLNDRKEDILPLAHLFLSETNQQTKDFEKRLNKTAEKALSSLRYRDRNATELRDAVEFAAFMAEGLEIGSEHIFTGPTTRGHRIEYDLGQLPSVQNFVKSNAPQMLRIAMLGFFLAIVLICLVAANTTAGKVANSLIWGLWWPSLMVLFLFIGRIWCFVCPISTAGRLMQKIWSVNHPPPPGLKSNAGWVMALLFFLIIWCEHYFHMPTAPAATGIFLLTLMTLSVVLCIAHQHEVWCRYMCPLGSLSAAYSVSSLIQVHANQKVCSTQCKTHECSKGSETDPACPMYHHPLFVRDAHFCKLCLSCLRTCRHQSAKFYFRPLLQDIWRLGDLSATLIPFALVAFTLSIVMLAAYSLAWKASIFGIFTGMALLAVAAAVLLNTILPRLLSPDRDPTITSRVTFALLVLAWGPFMAFHLGNVPELESIRIRAHEASLLVQYLPTLDLTLLIVLQYAAIIVSAIFAAITFWRIRVHSAKQGATIAPWGWNILSGICAIYLLAAIVLVYP